MSEEAYKAKVNEIESAYKKLTVEKESEECKRQFSEALYRLTKEYMAQSFAGA